MRPLRLAVPVLTVFAAAAPVAAQVVYDAVPVLEPRIGHQLIGDVGRLWLTGGNQGGSSLQFPEVWTFANGNWSGMGALDPHILEDAAFDRVRQRLVGTIGLGGFGLTLLEWDGNSTSYVGSVPSSLYFCEQHRIAFDEARGGCVLHGYDSQTAGNELWLHDGATWTQLASSFGPGFGSYRLLATPTGALLLVGQTWSNGTVETWQWSGGTWSLVPTPSLDPSRCDATNDPVTGDAFLAGYAAGATVMSVFRWNGSGWASLGSGGPDLGFQFRVAHDGTRLCAFGGIHYGAPNVLHGETWGFAAGQWTLLGGQQPMPLASLTGCLDELRGRTVLSGSRATQMETWEYDGGLFALRAVEALPAGGFLIAYDRGRGAVVQHRGDGSTCEWNGSAWVATVAPGVGPVRSGAALGYDGQRVLLFGGAGPGAPQASQQTWAYDGVAWTLLAPASSPPPGLVQPQLVHDPRRGVTNLFASFHPNVYEWNGATWTSAGSVPWTDQRSEQFAGYHAARGRVVVGGGQVTVMQPAPVISRSPEVWEWDGSTFAPLPPLASGHVRSALIGLPDGDAVIGGGWDTDFHMRGDWIALRSPNGAVVQTIGAGCAGSAGIAGLGAAPGHWPWLGETAVFRCAPMPAAAPVALWVLGARSDADAFGPLPRDLTALGATACFQRVSIDQWWIEPANGGASSAALFVPPAPWLAGAVVFLQALVPDAVNPAGFVLSDAAAAVIGVR